MSAILKTVSGYDESHPCFEFKPSHRILVVEDEPEIAKIYAEILGQKSDKISPIKSSRLMSSRQAVPQGKGSVVSGPEFQLEICQSAHEALFKVRKSVENRAPFAMGFFDVLLGEGMDGIELVKEIHQIDPHMYAVFVTAYHDRSVNSIREFLGAHKEGHWDYLNKPFSSGEILQKARSFVSLWNLRGEKLVRDHQLAQAHRRLLEYERTSSVAAVARGVSHEFGNILMQIMGKADLGRSKNEAEMRETMDRILEATHRAAEILDRFKDLSQGGGASQKSTIVLGDLLSEALDLMEHPLKTHRVKICKIKMDKVELRANSTALLQVFVNLIINAIHAMGDGGQIDFSLRDTGRGVETRVRDYGPGIKPEMLDKVLEPFFTTKGSQGTGLGLSICREIIEVEHRGQFSLSNHPAKGLEVAMNLPYDADKEGEDS